MNLGHGSISKKLFVCNYYYKSHAHKTFETTRLRYSNCYTEFNAFEIFFHFISSLQVIENSILKQIIPLNNLLLVKMQIIKL